jgi:hypothetical protein
MAALSQIFVRRDFLSFFSVVEFYFLELNSIVMGRNKCLSCHVLGVLIVT